MDCILCYHMATKRQIKYWQGNPDSKVHGAYIVALMVAAP